MTAETNSARPGDMPKLQKTHEGEHHGDYGDSGEVPITRSTYLFALCAAINSINLGYDIGTSTSAGKLVQKSMDLSMTQREIFVGSLNFWAMFGAIFAQYCTDVHGRRRTFIVAAVAFIAGCIIMAAAPTYGMLMFGRCFVGLGVGTGLAIDPMYISEVTPAKHRGQLVTWSEIALNVGIVLGFAMSLFLASMSDDVQWRIMFLLGVILPSVMIYLAINVMPESPRWLVANGQEQEARQVLMRIYPDGYNVNPVVDDIRESIEREQAAEQTIGWGVILRPTPAFRRMLVVGVGIAIAQQAVGIDAIQYYLVDIIEEAGYDSSTKESLVLIFIGLVKLFFILVGGKLFDKRGRKPLLFVSLTGLAVSLLLISFAYFINSSHSKGFVVFAIIIYMAFFSIGMGPGAWLLASEVFATCIRAKAMSVATLANRATAFLMSSTFLSTANAMGWGAFFFMLTIVCVIVLGFVHIYLPETKGRSLEDMSIYFAEITGDQSVIEAEAKIRGTSELRSGPSSTAQDSTLVTEML